MTEHPSPPPARFSPAWWRNAYDAALAAAANAGYALDYRSRNNYEEAIDRALHKAEHGPDAEPETPYQPRHTHDHIPQPSRKGDDSVPVRYRYGIRRCDPTTNPNARRFEVYDKTTGQSASRPCFKAEARRLARQFDETDRHHKDIA